MLGQWRDRVPERTCPGRGIIPGCESRTKETLCQNVATGPEPLSPPQPTHNLHNVSTTLCLAEEVDKWLRGQSLVDTLKWNRLHEWSNQNGATQYELKVVCNALNIFEPRLVGRLSSGSIDFCCAKRGKNIPHKRTPRIKYALYTHCYICTVTERSVLLFVLPYIVVV